jgi:hypothetical protein
MSSPITAGIADSRREFLKIAATAAGAALLSACSGDVVPVASAEPAAGAAGEGGTSATTTASATASSATTSSSGTTSTSGSAGTSAPPTTPAPVAPVSTTATVSSTIASLKTFLSTRASPNFALPPAPASIPEITWAGALTPGDYAAATSLPNGIIFSASSALINGPLRKAYAANLPGNPVISGYPCLAVLRPFSCRGVRETVGSPTILRFKTDAPTVELSGAVTDNAQSVQTLIIDGALVPPIILSAGRGWGGSDSATLRIGFGSRQVRDIWIETAMDVAYLKIDQHDSLFAVDDEAEPQMTVVGDSYQLVNSNAFGNGGAMALELGARLGIRNVAADAVGGTGYWNSGKNIGNFNDRLPAHGADESTIYLVIGGLNDYGDALPDGTIAWPTRATYENAVSGYLLGLRAMNPNALIVVTAPFCPDPPMSDSSYVAWAATNSSGLGDFLYRAQLHKNAIQQVSAPWVYIDVLMGTGWINSSGASGDVTDLQWFTGGTPGPGTTATYKPGNTNGGAGGGFGGIQFVPILSGGGYTQAPDLMASGGTGSGLLLASRINSAGAMIAITTISPGTGYTAGAGLPQIAIDPTYEISPATLGPPVLMIGVNPNGQYPLQSLAPPGSAGELNNIYAYLTNDRTHPSPLGVNYLSTRLAQNIYAAVLAL